MAHPSARDSERFDTAPNTPYTDNPALAGDEHNPYSQRYAAHLNDNTTNAALLPPPQIGAYNRDSDTTAFDTTDTLSYAGGDLRGQSSNPKFNGLREQSSDPKLGAVPLLAESEKPHGFGSAATKSRKKRWWWIIAALAFAIVVVAVIVPVYFLVIKKDDNSKPTASSGESSSTSNGGGPATATGTSPMTSGNIALTTGKDGSTVMMENGQSFVYQNKFGGFWVFDPANPFSNNARANEWTPALNTSWKWGVDRVKGVNIGGLFVLEPFISPALFQAYPGTVDEWTLSQAMAADTANGGLEAILEKHYSEFITEQDIAQIAGAGLNWIRLPIPYWALEVWKDGQTAPGPAEPFLARSCWPHILRVIGWARKYGLRVNLDLHTIPGSQNGYNHSGKLGQVNFLLGPMGLANAQRTLGYIKTLTEFFTQPEYTELVGIFSVVNEALVNSIGKNVATSFYNEVHNMIREITGIGEGKGMYMAIHDGFSGTGSWADFLTGSDRIMLDTHPYFSFDGSKNDEPIDTGVSDSTAGGTWPFKACDRWAAGMNTSRVAFGVTIAGEWSNGFNDCGLYLRGTVPYSTSFPGSCALYQDASLWSDGLKKGLRKFNMAQMDTFGDWFFWTWKIGNSTAGHVESPLWSYKLGLEMGFITSDPREADGLCAKLDVVNTPFSTFSAWQTGGAGAGTILAPAAWPPASISSGMREASLGVIQLAALPTYTSTGNAVALPVQTLTVTMSGKGGMATQTVLGSGGVKSDWKAAVPVQGCVGVNGYLDPWAAMGSAGPTTVCGGAPVTAGVVPPAAAAVTSGSRSATSTTSEITAAPVVERRRRR